ASAMLLASILATLTISGHIEIWHIFVLTSLLGVVNAFDIPARQSFIVEMVGREDLVNAIALNSSIVNGARLVGPAVAGVLVSLVGEGWCFAANALSYIAVIVGLLWMDVPGRVIEPRAGSALHSVGEGFDFVAATPPVRSLMLLLGLVSLMGMPYSTLMPVFADRVLREGGGGGRRTRDPDGDVGCRSADRCAGPGHEAQPARPGTLGRMVVGRLRGQSDS